MRLTVHQHRKKQKMGHQSSRKQRDKLLQRGSQGQTQTNPVYEQKKVRLLSGAPCSKSAFLQSPVQFQAHCVLQA